MRVELHCRFPRIAQWTLLYYTRCARTRVDTQLGAHVGRSRDESEIVRSLYAHFLRDKKSAPHRIAAKGPRNRPRTRSLSCLFHAEDNSDRLSYRVPLMKPRVLLTHKDDISSRARERAAERYFPIRALLAEEM